MIDSEYLSNHWRSTCKKSRGNTIDCKFLQNIWFHTQRKDEVNTSHIWSSQRNYQNYKDALQKHKSNDSLTQWQYQLLQHCCWNLARRSLAPYISIISLEFMLWMSIYLIKKCFHFEKKNKKQTISRRNDHRHRQHSTCHKNTCPSQITAA